MGECHACGGAVVETPKAWSCSTYKETGCRFTIWKDSLDKLGHSAITATEIKKLLKKEETWLKFQKKDYPTIDRLCEIEVRGDRYGIKIDFEGEGRPEILGTCPICSAEMIESPKAFNCRGNNQQDCNFTIWKNCLERFNGKLLTKVQLKKLLKDQKIPVEIRNKEGEKQTVNLLIDEKYGVKIDFAGSKKQGDTPS
jgi:hypothetical protein